MDTIIGVTLPSFKVPRLDAYGEGRGVLLHQAVQRGLFRAVTLVVDRGAIGRPLRLLHRSLHARLPKW